MGTLGQRTRKPSTKNVRDKRGKGLKIHGVGETITIQTPSKLDTEAFGLQSRKNSSSSLNGTSDCNMRLKLFSAFDLGVLGPLGAVLNSDSKSVRAGGTGSFGGW